MPFSITLEVTDDRWLFGSDWCDLWHSFDVLASTASILNLSVIALDRYWAITDPIAYSGRMSTGRALVLIALVWICSSAISFPAIAWWRSVLRHDDDGDRCAFTDDAGYLVFSSLVSFYCPVSIILFAYYRIYRAAIDQIRSLKRGSKIMVTSDGVSGEVMTLRIHRGGGANRLASCKSGSFGCSVDFPNPSKNGRGGERAADQGGRYAQVGGQVTSRPAEIRLSRIVSRRWRNFAVSRKLSKVMKEQKAAKTLGIVMGVFCVCWVPFFVTNSLYAVCKVANTLTASVTPIFCSESSPGSVT